MEILGYIASLFIGISLGLVGAGGSILTVPVLVYLFHVPVLAATSYSLFVVGMTSMMGTYQQFKRELVDVKVAILFSFVSLAIVFLIRRHVLPGVPSQPFWINDVPVTSAQISMWLFALLMIMAAWAMIRQKRADDKEPLSAHTTVRLLFCAMLVGLVTGFLGAGGGFILIPSLVLLLRLPMKKAIGTSLMIIALNSLFGFTLDIGRVDVDWTMLGGVTLVAIAGIFLGMALGRGIAAKNLKCSFGWMVMLLGIAIMVIEMTAFVKSV